MLITCPDVCLAIHFKVTVICFVLFTKIVAVTYWRNNKDDRVRHAVRKVLEFLLNVLCKTLEKINRNVIQIKNTEFQMENWHLIRQIAVDTFGC